MRLPTQAAPPINYGQTRVAKGPRRASRDKLANGDGRNAVDGNPMDQRREPRFKFEGATLLVFDDAELRRTVAVTQYFNVSRRGACVVPPATEGLSVGSRLTLLPQPYLERREVIVVNRQQGSLHLELPDSQEFSEFEVAEMVRGIAQQEQE